MKYPVDCDGFGIRETQRKFSDVTGDQREDAMVLVSCNGDPQAANNEGTPVYLLVYDGASPAGRLELLATMGGGFQKQVSDFYAEEGELVVVSDGWSEDAPGCCPDESISDVYTGRGGRFRRISHEVLPVNN